MMLAPPVLAVVYLGSPYFDLVALAVAAILGFEWTRMCGDPGRSPLRVVTVISVSGAVFAAGFLGSVWAILVLICGGLLAPVVALLSSRPAGWPALGVLYLGGCMALLVWLRGDPETGRTAVLLLLAVVWATDTGAYVAGRTIGGPKLAPVISPNKTWAGLAGGVVCAAVAGLIGEWVIDRQIGGHLALLGGFLALIAQAGDLFESWVKRRFKVKDSGTIIPGHGGLLDRVDGLMAAGAAMAVLFAATEQGGRAWL